MRKVTLARSPAFVPRITATSGAPGDTGKKNVCIVAHAYTRGSTATRNARGEPYRRNTVIGYYILYLICVYSVLSSEAAPFISVTRRIPGAIPINSNLYLCLLLYVATDRT